MKTYNSLHSTVIVLMILFPTHSSSNSPTCVTFQKQQFTVFIQVSLILEREPIFHILLYINISYSWCLFNLFNFSISLMSFICVYLVLISVYIEELVQQIRVTKLFRPAKNFLTGLFISRIGYLLRQWAPYWKHLSLEILLVA